MSDPVVFEPILTSREKRELRDEVFRRRALVGVDLADADLRGARFESVSLERCNLAGADLRGAQFIGCDLREVVLTATKLGDNRFHGTTVCGGIGLSEESRLAIIHAGGVVQPLHAS